MTGIQKVFRRWQIAHEELQQHHLEESRSRSRAMLGAYGLTSSGKPAGRRSTNR